MPRRHTQGYTFRGCTIIPPACRTGRRRKGADHAGWEIHLPDGTPVEERPRTIRAAYALILQHPQALPRADHKTTARLGGQAFHKKYKLVPVGTSDFAILDRETGEATRTMNGYYIERSREDRSQA